MSSIDIKGMKAKDWKALRNLLEIRLANINWRISGVIRTDTDEITLKGGRLPISFNLNTGRCIVWGKCSRYAHGSVEIDRLVEVMAELKEWQKEALLSMGVE